MELWLIAKYHGKLKSIAVRKVHDCEKWLAQCILYNRMMAHKDYPQSYSSSNNKYDLYLHSLNQVMQVSRLHREWVHKRRIHIRQGIEIEGK